MLSKLDSFLWKHSRAYRRFIMRRSGTWQVLMAPQGVQEMRLTPKDVADLRKVLDAFPVHQ